MSSCAIGPSYIPGFHSSFPRLLVEWNHAIFDTFIPLAWEKLLDVLVQEDNYDDIWSAWPPSAHDRDGSYWQDLPRSLMTEALSAGHAICPLIPVPGVTSHHVSLTSALVASTDDSPTLLMALAQASVLIIQPPSHIFQLLKTSEVQFIDPANVRQFLLVCYF